MATGSEDLQGTLPITPEEIESFQETIETALDMNYEDNYSVKVVGEPDRTGDADYAVAVIKKLSDEEE